ncbi:uncharacterized protein N7477_007738 [Penicillium maclennaniae]|uniref:uncharacterized protein n=1 Tax=Penicillium maclennaniae TaxID=1343394 RepID=UPI002540F168|nr:uncharacterized protein N7477_007738 [Penicillium maclennaniae]KAJ5665290.1 hypothetical protein N7477_007738 [Penicillium maclennaniae]
MTWAPLEGLKKDVTVSCAPFGQARRIWSETIETPDFDKVDKADKCARTIYSRNFLSTVGYGSLRIPPPSLRLYFSALNSFLHSR